MGLEGYDSPKTQVRLNKLIDSRAKVQHITELVRIIQTIESFTKREQSRQHNGKRNNTLMETLDLQGVANSCP